jgi:hypothetical protein
MQRACPSAPAGGGQLPGRVQQRLADQQLVGGDPGRLGGRGRGGQAVQVTLQAGAVVNGQDQQHPVLRPAATRRAGRGLRGAGRVDVCHDGLLLPGTGVPVQDHRGHVIVSND